MSHLKRAGSSVVVAALLGAVILSLSLSGCGEKIAIPQPDSIFGNFAYSVDTTATAVDARQIAFAWGNLYVLSADSLSKRDTEFVIDNAIALDGDPTALCFDDSRRFLFVWEQATRTVRIFNRSNLESVGSATLPEVESVSSMAMASAGIDTLIPGGRTFLFLSDPTAGVIHRYAVMGASDESFTCTECLDPYGFLAWPTGDGARSIHEPGALVRDSEGYLLACERDTARNWVLRYNGAPDLGDATPIDPEAPEPIEAWAGTAVIFGQPTCAPEPAVEDYVLGDAPSCNQTDWRQAPRDSTGVFEQPNGMAIDGRGWIFVADPYNARVQVFLPDGEYEAQFKIESEPGTELGEAVSLGMHDIEEFYAAYVYLLTEGSDVIYKLISDERYLEENDKLPERQD